MLQKGVDFTLCDEVMKKVISIVGECKINNNKQNIYTYLVGLVVGQKIRFATARKIRSKLYEETGSYNFTPSDIIKLTEEQWDKTKMEEWQKNRILNVTDYFIDNNIDVNNVTKNDIKNLKKIDGIGDWTIDSLQIEYGLDLNLFPLIDKHVNKKLSKLYNIENKTSVIKKHIEKWAPYRSIAFWYLWKYELN